MKDQTVFSGCKEHLTFQITIPAFEDQGRSLVENNVGKGDNASKQHFLLNPQGFLPFHRKFS